MLCSLVPKNPDIAHVRHKDALNEMPENTFRGEVTFLNLQKVAAFNPQMHCFKLLQMFLRVKYHLIPLERIPFHLDLWKVLICRDCGGTLISKSFLKHCFPGKAQLMTFSLPEIMHLFFSRYSHEDSIIVTRRVQILGTKHGTLQGEWGLFL